MDFRECLIENNPSQEVQESVIRKQFDLGTLSREVMEYPLDSSGRPIVDSRLSYYLYHPRLDDGTRVISIPNYVDMPSRLTLEANLDVIERRKLLIFNFKPPFNGSRTSKLQRELEETQDLLNIAESSLKTIFLGQRYVNLTTIDPEVNEITGWLVEKFAPRRNRIEKRVERLVEYMLGRFSGHLQSLDEVLEAKERKGKGEKEHYVELIKVSAALHDIGKILIPITTLLKPGKLTPGEYTQMKMHPTYGGALFKGVDNLSLLRSICENHHERYDGTGYPRGLRGDKIPLASTLVTFADVFDALYSRRVYKDPWPLERIQRAMIHQHDVDGRGSFEGFFSPEIV